jgi:hypothetical protein
VTEEPQGEGPPSTFESLASSWVPPWAREMPELRIEPAAEYGPQELGVGRFAYGDRRSCSWSTTR